MKIEIKRTELGRHYFVLNEKGEPIGGISDKDSKMLDWLQQEDIWRSGEDFKIKERYPNLNTGTMLYAINDPEKKPYRWKVWDGAERCSEMYDFLYPEEADYTFTLKLPWDK
jgi:hypothetical protein